MTVENTESVNEFEAALAASAATTEIPATEDVLVADFEEGTPAALREIDAEVAE